MQSHVTAAHGNKQQQAQQLFAGVEVDNAYHLEPAGCAPCHNMKLILAAPEDSGVAVKVPTAKGGIKWAYDAYSIAVLTHD